jgi:hypothetical protein
LIPSQGTGIIDLIGDPDQDNTCPPDHHRREKGKGQEKNKK